MTILIILCVNYSEFVRGEKEKDFLVTKWFCFQCALAGRKLLRQYELWMNFCCTSVSLAVAVLVKKTPGKYKTKILTY